MAAFPRSLLVDSYPQVQQTNGKPLIQMPANWNGPRLIKSIIPGTYTLGPQFTGTPTILVGLKGRGTCKLRCGHKTTIINTAPSCLHIHSSTWESDASVRQGEPGLGLALSLPPNFIQRYLPERAHDFELKTALECRDDKLLSIILRFAGELENGLVNGPLYAEGLALAILGLLGQHYAIKAGDAPTTGKLSRRDQVKLKEFIESNLAGELTIEKMATLLGLSSSHFCALFKTTFARTPHRYVMQQRIDKAALLLRTEPKQTVTDIAISTGFSSQAHLTYAFKKHMKQTPIYYRRG